MSTKKVVWKIKQGNKFGQETSDQKLAEGEVYIQKLRDAGENITNIEDTGESLVITIEE